MAFNFDPRQRAGLSALGYKPPVNPWEKYGYRDEDIAGLLNTSEGDLPILEETTMVEPAPGVSGTGSTLGLRGGSGVGAGIGGHASAISPDEEITVRPRPEPPAFLGDFGKWIDEGGPEQGIREGGNRLVDIYNGMRTDPPVTTPWGLRKLLQVAPELKRHEGVEQMQGEVPGQLAPSAAPSAPTASDGIAPEIGLTPEQWRAKHGMVAAHPPASHVTSSFSSADRDPMFSDVNQEAPEALDQAGTLRRRELATGGTEWTGSPHEGIDPTTGQPTKYGSISITMHGQESPEQRARAIEGLKSRAFNAAPSGPDPQAEAMMRLAGVGGGGGHVMQGVPGPDVSQASLEHAMQQRAAQAHLSDMESQARARSAEATARERDPLGIEKLRAQQALEAARFGYQNEGRREVSLADDQYRAQQQSALNVQRDKARTDYIDNRRALEEQIAAYPPNLPPDSPEAAYVSRLQRELDRLNQDAEIQLHARIG